MAARFANKIHSLVNNVVLRTPSVVVPRHLQPAFIAGLKIQSQNYEPAGINNAPRTRYPLNQQDANSYIESLKAKVYTIGSKQEASDDVQRTFNVLLCARPNAKPVASTELSFHSKYNQRHFASGSRGKKKQSRKICKEPDLIKRKKDEKKSLKDDDDQCPKFKMNNCKRTKEFICTRRPYIFADRKKRPAPYASFSETCYEDPPSSVNECRDCPWVDKRHPTFKRPKDRFGKPERKFHTDARIFANVSCNQSDEAYYDALNKDLFEQKAALRKLPSSTQIRTEASAQVLSTPPRSQLTDIHQELFYLKQASQQIAPVNAQRIKMLLMGKKAVSPRHKIGSKKVQQANRPKKPPGECDNKPCSKMPFKPAPVYDIQEKLKEIEEEKKRRGGNKSCTCLGVEKPSVMMKDNGNPKEEGMLCKMVPKKPDNPNDLTCEKLAPSPVCPKNLLDRKPYPKYRKEMKKRLAKEKEIEKKRKAMKARKQAEKPPKGKKCAGVEEEKVFEVQAIKVSENADKEKFEFMPFAEVTFMQEMRNQQTEFNIDGGNNCQIIENMILAKDRVRIKPRKCPEHDCHTGFYSKKRCRKEKLPKVCPKDLLDNKPYKKYRKRKAKCEKGKKGKKRRGSKGKGKKAAGVNQEDMTAMLMESVGVSTDAPRTAGR